MGERDQRSSSLLEELGVLVSEISLDEDLELLVDVARRIVRGRATASINGQGHVYTRGTDGGR